MTTRDIGKIALIVLPILLVVAIIYIIVFVPINGTMICKDDFTMGELNQKSIYTVSFKYRKVNTIHFVQTITSSNEDAIIEHQKSLLDSIKETKDPNKKESLSFDGTKLKYEMTIKYKKKKEKISVGKLKEIYKESGTTCKYK